MSELLKTGPDSANRAVDHILRRMQDDGRLAYLLGEGSESFELLTQAHAEHHGKNLKEFRETFGASLEYESWRD